MIEGQHKRECEKIQKSTLYILKTDNIEFVDKQSKDKVNVVYEIKDGQNGLFAMEFRPLQVPKTGAKVIDLSMGIDDYANKKCIWGLYDVKHTLGGKDEAFHLGEQWQAALRYWYNSVLNYMDGYDKTGTIGVVTTCYEKSKIATYIELLKSKLKHSSKLNGTLVGAKVDIDIVRVREELKFYENFYNNKFVYRDPNGNEENYEFDVIVSEYHTFKWKL